MASLQWRRRGNGETAVIQFYDERGRRRSIGIGRISKRMAGEIFHRVETLLDSRYSGEPLDPRTSAWLRGVGQGLRRQLECFGLIEPVAASAHRLGDFLAAYVDGRADVKGATRTVYSHTVRCLLGHFGPDRPLDSITPGDMDDWRQYLIGEQGLAENTARRRCGIARQFFNAARRKRIISENPCEHLTVTVRGSQKKRCFVTLEMSQAILDACPDVEWRALFTLARWGGLRVPSEALALSWSDVDWAEGRLRVPSPKTEHHEGGEERHIPLFPEIRIALQQAFEAASPGATHIIARYRRQDQNLRTQLVRIVRRAGLAPWPKPWVNLRATRATEIFSTYPRHVGEAWMGHCFDVSMEHYLSVPPEQFRMANEQACAIRVPSSPIIPDHAHTETPFLRQQSRPIVYDDAMESGKWALQDSNL